MGEGLGRDPTAGRALDPIVTNGSGCIQSVGDLGATDLALIVGSVAPHPGEAVRLQFETDGQRPTLTGVGLLQQYAYTVDGSDLGEVEDETFSADTAVVNITGHDVHPGHAKNVMINAVRAAAAAVEALPVDLLPETTDGRQPYLHPYSMSGEVSSAQATVSRLINQFGFDVVDAGPLKEGWRIQRDTPGYGPRRTAEEIRRDLAAARRYVDQ